MTTRSGIYAGCTWLFIAAWTAFFTYWGFGLAGPSAGPTVLANLALVGVTVMLAGALWTKRGGPIVAVASLALGIILTALPLFTLWESDRVTGFGLALFGVAICLTSAYAVRRYSKPTNPAEELPCRLVAKATPQLPRTSARRRRGPDRQCRGRHEDEPGDVCDGKRYRVTPRSALEPKGRASEGEPINGGQTRNHTPIPRNSRKGMVGGAVSGHATMTARPNA